MKLILIKDDNADWVKANPCLCDKESYIEIENIQGIDGNCELLLIRVKYKYKPEDVDLIEECLSSKTGKKVVLLDPTYGEVLMVK